MIESPLLPFVEDPVDVARFVVEPVGLGGELPDVDGLLAGAAEVDITPPPGMPKAGFSNNAHDGTGFRTRLRARVLHLRSGRTSLALVQLDLLSGSSLLRHLVARAVAERTDVRLPGLFMGATHTNAGPGQFDASAFYNRFASNRPGFDPAWTQWLTDRVAGAVIEAVETRGPARLAVGRTEVWGLTRNRSLQPYLRNESVPDKRVAAQRKFAAVNPWLHLVLRPAGPPLPRPGRRRARPRPPGPGRRRIPRSGRRGVRVVGAALARRGARRSALARPAGTRRGRRSAGPVGSRDRRPGRLPLRHPRRRGQGRRPHLRGPLV